MEKKQESTGKKGKKQNKMMDALGVNGEMFNILEVINRNEFIIDCDTTQLTDYDRNGVVKGLKAKITTEFKPLGEILRNFSGETFD